MDFIKELVAMAKGITMLARMGVDQDIGKGLLKAIPGPRRAVYPGYRYCPPQGAETFESRRGLLERVALKRTYGKTKPTSSRSLVAGLTFRSIPQFNSSLTVEKPGFIRQTTTKDPAILA